MNTFLDTYKKEVYIRLDSIYKGIMKLKAEGFKVDAISPQAAIYLTVQFNLKGKKTASGKLIESTKDITSYLLQEAKVAIVPFYAFGSATESTWYRISVGTLKIEDINHIIDNLRKALAQLK